MTESKISRIAKSVEELLSNRDALDAFKKWAQMDETRCASSISLHFAVKQYKKLFEKRIEEAASLAVQTHKTYVSLKTGNCTFLPVAVREELSRRAHAIKSSPPSSSFFDPLIPYLDDHLRMLHATFVCSQNFYDLSRELSPSHESMPSPFRKDRATSLSTSASPSYKQPSSKLFTVSSMLPTNPFRTYKTEVKTEIKEENSSFMRGCEPSSERESFAGQLGDKLHRLQQAMSARGVEFARDLREKENVDDLNDDSIDRDIDDYAHRLDDTAEKSSNSPPSLPATAPPSAPPPAFDPYGKNGFAPPPSTNRLRRKMLECTEMSHSSSSASSKKGRSSTYIDSSSSGFYSGLPSSSSSAFSTQFSHNPHFNTLRRPSQNAVPQFPLNRPSYPLDTFMPFSQLTPFDSPSHSSTLPHGFATLPRPSSKLNECSSKDGKVLLKVIMAGSRPMVFKADPEEGEMTLKKFRTIFGISKEKNKFFFKTESEDDSSDFQWELITDDGQLVPLYKGAITGECRPVIDSP